MKRILSVILVLSLLFVFAACGKETDDITDNNDITVNPDDSIQEQISDVQNIISDVIEENVQSNIGSYETPAESDFDFESVADGVKIVSYTGAATSINVPETLGGSNVVEIGQAAFNDAGIVAIKLPDTLVKVGESAFYYCTTLNEVVLGQNTTEISYSAFMGCLALTSIKLADSVKIIGDEAFSTCSSLKIIDLNNGIEEIGAGSFVMSGIEEITIPGTVVAIEESAFSTCSELKSVVIEEGVTKIASKAFETCSSLETVTIPASVTEIEARAFQQCPNLTICAPAGSAAETFATTYEINFKAI